MPIFDIRCDSCSHEWESILKDSKAQTDTCPTCGSAFTKVVWLSTPKVNMEEHPGVNPYRHLDKGIPGPKLHFGPPKGGWKK